MRIFTVLLASLASCSGWTTEIVTSDQSLKVSPKVIVPSVQEYYQPRSGDHPGRPDWPSKLTFEAVPTQSVKEFKASLVGSWSPVFTCAGRPVTTEELKKNTIYDGVTSEAVQYQFDGTAMTQRLFAPSGAIRRGRTQTHSGPIMVEAKGQNKFKVTYGGTIDSTPSLMRLVKVKETGTLVILGEDPDESQDAHCDNGDVLQGLMLPVPLS